MRNITNDLARKEGESAQEAVKSSESDAMSMAEAVGGVAGMDAASEGEGVSEANRRAIEASIDALRLTSERKVNLIVLHCSATPEGRHGDAATIRRWHTQERGFIDIGYHFVVRLDGTVEPGRPVALTGAHCLGHNRNSIGVCYIGGTDVQGRSKDTRTPAQRVALDLLVERLRRCYPQALVKKHRQLSPTLCPGF